MAWNFRGEQEERAHQLNQLAKREEPSHTNPPWQHLPEKEDFHGNLLRSTGRYLENSLAEVSLIFLCVSMYISVSSLKQTFSARDGSKSNFHIEEDKSKTKVNCVWGEGWQPAKLWKTDHGMESLEGVLFLKGVQRQLLGSLSGALQRP